jgi:hypothetical protein
MKSTLTSSPGAAQPHIFVLSPRCSTIPSLISFGSRTWLLRLQETAKASRQSNKRLFIFLFLAMYRKLQEKLNRELWI